MFSVFSHYCTCLQSAWWWGHKSDKAWNASCKQCQETTETASRQVREISTGKSWKTSAVQPPRLCREMTFGRLFQANMQKKKDKKRQFEPFAMKRAGDVTQRFCKTEGLELIIRNLAQTICSAFVVVPHHVCRIDGVERFCLTCPVASSSCEWLQSVRCKDHINSQIRARAMSSCMMVSWLDKTIREKNGLEDSTPFKRTVCSSLRLWCQAICFGSFQPETTWGALARLEEPEGALPWLCWSASLLTAWHRLSWTIWT